MTISTHNFKSAVKNETTIVAVVQNYFDPEHGLVTLKLHRQPISQGVKSGMEYSLNRQDVVCQQAEIKVKEFGIALSQAYALVYLQECENIFKKEGENNVPSEYQQSNDDLKKTKIKQEPVGDIDKLEYRNGTIIYEQTFEYKYAGISINAAFGRVKLDSDFQLLGITVVFPESTSFQNVKYDQLLISKDSLVEILTKHAIRIEQHNLSDDVLQKKWCFDTRVGEWKLAYIVRGVTNQNQKRVNRENHQSLGEMPFEIVKYIIDATNGTLIDKIYIT